MTLHQRPPGEVLSTTSPMLPERGRWNWRRALQGAWIALALLLLVIFVANIPAFFQYARTVCTLPDVGNCPTEQLTPAYVQLLGQLHLSVAVAEVVLAALCVAVSVVESRYVVPPSLLKVSQSRTGQVILRLNQTLSEREALK
jgi:hypothetical protein